MILSFNQLTILALDIIHTNLIVLRDHKMYYIVISINVYLFFEVQTI